MNKGFKTTRYVTHDSIPLCKTTSNKIFCVADWIMDFGYEKEPILRTGTRKSSVKSKLSACLLLSDIRSRRMKEKLADMQYLCTDKRTGIRFRLIGKLSRKLSAASDSTRVPITVTVLSIISTTLQRSPISSLRPLYG